MRRCVYFAFFSQLPDSFGSSPSFSSLCSAFSHPFPRDSLPPAIAPNQTHNWQNYKSWVHKHNCCEVAHQERGRREQKKHQCREQQEQRELQAAHHSEVADCQPWMVHGTKAELKSPTMDFSLPKRLSKLLFIKPGDLENKLQANCANKVKD
ncbi:hypothetical protein BJX76DRAFT_343806 [Aspergillus varians]